MATNEFLKESLEHFKQQKQSKLQELRALDITIRQIQKQLGEVPDDQEDTLLLPSVADVKSNVVGQAGGTYKPRADEFFGMSQAEAARTYLEKIGHASLLEDILRGITGGGCKVGGADPKKTLYIALVQNKRDFVPIGSGNFGLRKFYPNMPKLGRPEGGGGQPKKAKRRMKKVVKKGKATQAASPRKKPSSGELNAAITEALGDHKAKTVEEVIRAVEKRLGQPITKIAVYGTLRRKDFEQGDDKRYRLRQIDEVSQVIQ